MRTIELNDHELSVTDFSNFELQLQARGGRCTAVFHNRTSPQGTSYVQLINGVVEFDEGQLAEADLDHLLHAYGFRRKLPVSP